MKLRDIPYLKRTHFTHTWDYNLHFYVAYFCYCGRSIAASNVQKRFANDINLTYLSTLYTYTHIYIYTYQTYQLRTWADICYRLLGT